MGKKDKLKGDKLHDQRFICMPGEYLPFTDG